MKKQRLINLAAFIVIAMMVSINLNAQPPNSWTQKANISSFGRGWASGFSIGNKGYIGLGTGQGMKLKDFWKYDKTNNVWTQKADFGGIERDAATGFSIGNKGYIGTGYNGGVYYNDFWEYDTLNDTWTQIASFPGAVRRGATGFSINGFGYVACGWDAQNNYFNDLWQYDPGSNSWQQKTSFPGAARKAATVFVIGDKAYLGIGGSSTVYQDFWEYDPNTDTWTQIADFGGSARQRAVGFSIGNKGYVGTGQLANGNLLQDFWEYDPESNSWTQKADFGGNPRQGAVGFSIGNKGYIGTGSDQNDFWEYTTDSIGCYAGFTAVPTTLCEGNSVAFTDLSVSIDSVIISWQWSFEGGTPATSTAQNPVITYNNDGEYDVQLIVSDGSYSDTLLQTDFIHVEIVPGTPGIPTGPTELCQTYSYNFTTTSVPYADVYNWLVIPADAGTFSSDSTSLTFMASPTWTGTFDIQVSAQGLCGTSPLSAPLTCELHHNPNLFQLSGTGDGGYCEGETGSELTLDGSDPGVDYELYLYGVATGIIVPGTGSPVSFGYISTEGLYSALGYTDYCSETMLGQVYVHPWALPGQAQTPVGNEETCDNESSVYTCDEIEDAEWYVWTLDPEQSGQLAPADDSVTITWNLGFSGNALLSVHGENDCGAGAESGQLIIDVSISPEPVISGPQNVISGSEEQYQTEDNPGNTYTWEVIGGIISAGGETNQVTILWGGPGEGSLTVTEESAEGCTTTTNPYLVVIDEMISIEENRVENMRIYPNPASETLHISIHSDVAEKVLVKITSLEGKVVYTSILRESVGDNVFQVSAENVPNGIYTLQINNGRPFLLIVFH